MNILLIILILVAIVCAALMLKAYYNKPITGSDESTHREIEYRFLLDDNKHEQKVKKLVKEAGGVKSIEALMPIIVYNPVQGDAYVRVRHEGDKITFTVKTNRNDKFPKEFEVELEPTEKNLEEMDLILTALGFTLKYKVEKVREFWHFPKNKHIKEVVFDRLPGVPTFFEIDTTNEAELNKMTRYLGFEPEDNIQAQDMYNTYYGVPTDRKIKPGNILGFHNAKENFAGMIEKNEKLFDKTLAEQQKYIKKFKK